MRVDVGITAVGFSFGRRLESGNESIVDEVESWGSRNV